MEKGKGSEYFPNALYVLWVCVAVADLPLGNSDNFLGPHLIRGPRELGIISFNNTYSNRRAKTLSISLNNAYKLAAQDTLEGSVTKPQLKIMHLFYSTHTIITWQSFQYQIKHCYTFPIFK